MMSVTRSIKIRRYRKNKENFYYRPKCVRVNGQIFRSPVYAYACTLSRVASIFVSVALCCMYFLEKPKPENF